MFHEPCKGKRSGAPHGVSALACNQEDKKIDEHNNEKTAILHCP